MTNNGEIRAGATFSGPGALIIPQNSTVSADSSASINILLANEGRFKPAGFGVGRVDVRDFQQNPTGTFDADLAGSGASAAPTLDLHAERKRKTGDSSIELKRVTVLRS